MENMIVYLLISVTFLLLVVFQTISTGIKGLIKVIGEIFIGLGIALLAGNVFANSIIENAKIFNIYLFAGIFLLFIGAIMKISGEYRKEGK